MEADVINQLEDQISRSEKHIRKAERLARLRSNSDFIELIEQDYLKDLATEYALFRGSNSCTGLHIEETDKGIIGVGQLNDYLRSIISNAQIAEQTITACRVELVAIETSEGEDE